MTTTPPTPRYRYEPHPEDAALFEVPDEPIDEDAEKHLRWLETGEEP